MTNETETFVNHLISQMTLEEKIGQLHQYFAGNRLDPEVLRQGKAGSVINASGALTGQGFSASSTVEESNEIQKIALESRLKIPVIFGRDVIHGYRTVFPIPLGQAAAFSPELVEQSSSVAASEASANGVKWTFAPMMDVARDARWGRVAEGSGEDPTLVSRLAAAAVRGFQGSDYSAPNKLVACAKHFVGYGAAEGGRDYDGAEISEPTLRDIYLPPFQAAVAQGVGTLMSAFHDLNGVPTSGNRWLLTDVLRGEWGFDGFVVSDWESVKELMYHGVGENEAEAAVVGLRAGVDMDMVSGVYLNTLAGSLQKGLVSLDEIEESVRRILRIKHRAGLFERPFTDPGRASSAMLTPESRALARTFARESMILLKNENNLLPLQGFRRILVTGSFLHATGELFGTWTPDGRAEDVTPIREALRQAAPKDVELWFTEIPELALQFAQRVDAVMMLVGEHPSRSGENANVSDLSLPPGQAEWIERITALGKPTTLVVFAGRPLAIGRQVSQAQAVLYTFHPGIEGGPALADVLFGAHAPGGRLPISMPRATGQAPIYYNHKPSGRPFPPLGPWNSRYADLPTSPLFPFGYGLTYTQFRYQNLHISSDTLRGQLEISAEITNTGQRTGTELVQLYTRDLAGSLTRPVRELKDFQRVELQAGETRRVSFTLEEAQLAFTRADGSFGVEPGLFHAWIAPNCQEGLRTEFRL